ATPSVRAVTCPWPGVSRRRSPPWMVTRGCPLSRRGSPPSRLPRSPSDQPHPDEATLPQLQNLAVDLINVDVELARSDRIPVDSHPCLGEAAACLGRRYAERLRHQRGKMHDLAVSRPPKLLDVLAGFVADELAMERHL